MDLSPLWLMSRCLARQAWQQTYISRTKDAVHGILPCFPHLRSIKDHPSRLLEFHVVERTLDPLQALFCHVRISLRRLDAIMPHQFLNVPYVHSILKQMRRKRMTQGQTKHLLPTRTGASNSRCFNLSCVKTILSNCEPRTSRDGIHLPRLRNNEPARTDLPGTKPNLQSRLYRESREKTKCASAEGRRGRSGRQRA